MSATHRVNPNQERLRRLMEISGLKRGAVYAGIQRGELPGSKVGGRIVLTERSLDLFDRYGTWPPPAGVDADGA